MTTKRSNSPYDLCQFTYADGRMCGLPTIPSGDGLCRSHASLKRFRPAPEEDAAPSLTDFASDPPSQEDVQRAVGRIMQALAANRISARRAATFGYLAQLLLQVHAGLQAEQRLQSLQGARDLHTLLKMKYGPALRRDAEKRPSTADPAPPSNSD